jgi:hypothetical protein
MRMLCSMRVIALTNDPVRLSFLAALLRDAGIDPLVLDGYASAVEGSIGAIPRRLVVRDEDEAQALRVLREAGLEAAAP